METLKKMTAQLTIIALVFLSLLPFKASALVPPLYQFGGTDQFTLICTCSDASWGFFAPLYLSPVPVAGPMVYFPAATEPLADYQITIPTVPHKGAFIPGVPACWEYAGYSCFPMWSYGVMAFVGTGVEGGGEQ